MPESWDKETTPMEVKAEAEIEIEFPLPEMGYIVAEAIKPELENSSTDRSKVDLFVREEGGRVFLCIKATDTSALRAALNSYLRWIGAIVKILNNVKKYNLGSIRSGNLLN